MPGYSLLPDPLEVTLPAEYTEEEAGKQRIDTQNAFYSQKERKYYITQLQYTVSDSVLLKMPSAGTSGHFAGMSGLLLIGAAVVYFSMKKRVHG